MGSFLTRDQTHVPCIGRPILKYLTTREAPGWGRRGETQDFFLLLFFLRILSSEGFGSSTMEGCRQTEMAGDPLPDRGALAQPSPPQRQLGKNERSWESRQPTAPSGSWDLHTKNRSEWRRQKEQPAENVKPEETTPATQDPRHLPWCSGVEVSQRGAPS